MRRPLHYEFTACLALCAGWAPDEAEDLAFYCQMTDAATPSAITEDWWPHVTGINPYVTQLTIKDAARLLTGERWWLDFDMVHLWHFGGGEGKYGPKEYARTLERLGKALISGDKVLAGCLIHCAEDYASHKDYRGYPHPDNRVRGDVRTWYWKLWHRISDSALSDDNVMGHVLRPELDNLEVSRKAIKVVAADLYQILRWHNAPDTCAMLYLLAAQDDAALERICKTWWRGQTNRDLPDFQFPSPQSERWKRWCS